MAGFTGEMAQKIYRGLASHRANLAGALQWDNPEAQAMQRFLEADPGGKKTTLVMPSPFSVKAKLANCCSKFAGVSVTAPASARGGGVGKTLNPNKLGYWLRGVKNDVFSLTTPDPLNSSVARPVAHWFAGRAKNEVSCWELNWENAGLAVR